MDGRPSLHGGMPDPRLFSCACFLRKCTNHDGVPDMKRETAIPHAFTSVMGGTLGPFVFFLCLPFYLFYAMTCTRVG